MYQHLNGEPTTIFGDGEQTRTFSFIDDSSLDLYELETSAVRDLPYTEQEAFFSGEASHGEEQPSATSSSLDW